MVLIHFPVAVVRISRMLFPSPCGDYGSYQLGDDEFFYEYDGQFPSPCGDYGSYHYILDELD